MKPSTTAASVVVAVAILTACTTSSNQSSDATKNDRAKTTAVSVSSDGRVIPGSPTEKSVPIPGLTGKTEIRDVRRPDGTTFKMKFAEIKPVVATVPAPPPMLEVLPGIRTRGQELADATAPGSKDADAAWLKVFDLAGIPVFDSGGQPLGATGDDPLGPRWSDVWMLGAPGEGHGMDLTSALSLGISSHLPTASPQDLRSLAPLFIRDIQAMSTSGDGQVVSQFLEEKLRQKGSGQNLLDPTFDDYLAAVDVPTFHLLAWMQNRSITMRLATVQAKLDAIDQTRPGVVDSTETTSASTGSGRGISAGLLFQTPTGDTAPSNASATGTSAAQAFDCGRFLTDSKTANDVVLFISKKLTKVVLGGSILPGVDMAGGAASVLDRILPGWRFAEKGLDELFGIDAAQRAALAASLKNGIDIAAKITAIASLLMKFLLLEMVPTELAPLRLSKPGTNSSAGALRVTIRYGESVLPDSAQRLGCWINNLSSVVGAKVGLLPVGPVPGAEVVLTGNRGFGDRLLEGKYKFANSAMLKQTTNSSGVVESTFIEGKVAASTKADFVESPDYGSVFVESQPNAIGSGTLVSLASAGLSLNYFGGLLAVLETTHFDLGEAKFTAIGWKAPVSHDDYLISGGRGNQLSGLLCNKSSSAVVSGPGFVVNLQPKSSRLSDLGTELVTGSFQEYAPYDLTTGPDLSKRQLIRGDGTFAIEWGVANQIGKFSLSGKRYIRELNGRVSTSTYKDDVGVFTVTNASAQCTNMVSTTTFPSSFYAFLAGPAGSVQAEQRRLASTTTIPG